MVMFQIVLIVMRNLFFYSVIGIIVEFVEGFFAISKFISFEQTIINFLLSCSSNFLHPTELDINNYPKKSLRICDYCFKYCQNYIRAKSPRNKVYNSFCEFEEIEELFLNISETIDEKTFDKDISDQTKQKINTIIKYLTQKEKISEKWYEKISLMVNNAINDVKPDTIFSSDFLDINNYIKVKKLIKIL